MKFVPTYCDSAPKERQEIFINSIKFHISRDFIAAWLLDYDSWWLRVLCPIFTPLTDLSDKSLIKFDISQESIVNEVFVVVFQQLRVSL